MKIPRKDFESFLNGQFDLLPPRPRPSRGRPSTILARVLPPRLPGLGAEIRCTHSVEKLYRHIFLKGTNQTLNKNERSLTGTLSLLLPEQKYLVIMKLLELQDHKVELRRKLRDRLREIFPELVPGDDSALESYEPEIALFRLYVQPVKVIRPQRKRGHTDHGSLASGPSWRDQMVEQEVLSDQSLVKRLKIFLRKFTSRRTPSLTSPS